MPISGGEYIPPPNTGSEFLSTRLDKKTVSRHLLLFVLTFISAALTGTLFVGHTADLPEDAFTSALDGFYLFLDMVLWEGVLFATLLLGFLTVHEFGHYFAAVRHRVASTLPYFIPFPLSPIGTLGAVIRIKGEIRNTKAMFDIGASGPIAGFAAAIAILLFGFYTLPDPAYMQNFAGHEILNEYIVEHGKFPDEPLSDFSDQHSDPDIMVLGNTLLFSIIASFFENTPPMWELYHYPFLFAGWLGLFFTALNLMPVGQLDGGHILYTLLGYRRHRIIAHVFFMVVMVLAGLGAVPLFENLLSGFDVPRRLTAWILWALLSLFLLDRVFRKESKKVLSAWSLVIILNMILLHIINPDVFAGFTIWVFWALFIVFLVKIEHPPVREELPLSKGRKILGWTCMIIFLLCISPNPIYFL